MGLIFKSFCDRRAFHRNRLAQFVEDHVTTGDRIRLRHAEVSAEAGGDGGNITLNGADRIEIDHTQVTAKAGSGKLPAGRYDPSQGWSAMQKRTTSGKTPTLQPMMANPVSTTTTSTLRRTEPQSQ